MTIRTRLAAHHHRYCGHCCQRTTTRCCARRSQYASEKLTCIRHSIPIQRPDAMPTLHTSPQPSPSPVWRVPGGVPYPHNLGQSTETETRSGGVACSVARALPALTTRHRTRPCHRTATCVGVLTWQPPEQQSACPPEPCLAVGPDVEGMGEGDEGMKTHHRTRTRMCMNMF